MTGKGSGGRYKRPPKKHCWKKGQLGNPRGRPPGMRNLAAALTAVLHENVSVTVEGEEQEVTKLEAVARQLVDKTMGGDARVMQQLLNEIHKNEAKAERENSAKALGAADREVLRRCSCASAIRRRGHDAGVSANKTSAGGTVPQNKTVPGWQMSMLSGMF